MVDRVLTDLWASLNAVSVLWYVCIGICLYVLRDKGYLRYPGTAKLAADAKAKKEDEARPLRERLKAKASERYDALCEDFDSDDAYKFLLNQLRAEMPKTV